MYLSLVNFQSMNSSVAYAVILTDWSKLSKAIWYPNARSRVYEVAKEINTLVTDMVRNDLILLENIHCIGHSLGAHTCGLASKLAKFGRITGRISCIHVQLDISL